MMTFKELKKLVKLPLYKEQRVPTVKALEESGVSVVAEKILENHGSISVYQNGYVIYRAHKRVTVFSLRNCVHYKYDALEGAGHHIEEEEFDEYEWHIRLVLEGEDRIFMNYEIIQGKWMPSREDREYREEILEGVDEAVSTLERMISEERVEELLSTLTDLQRKVVHTHLFHGLSFTEAAKHLGMTRQNLRRYEYTGALVMGRRKKIDVNTTSVRTLPEDKWIIAENAHEAIVTKDEYYQAQKAIRNVTPIQYKVDDDFALKGKICCGNCNRQLRHERQYGEMVFYCGYKRSAGKFSKCYGGYYREYSVNAKVARAIKTVFYALDVVNQGMQEKQSITVRCVDIEDLEKQAEAIRVEQIKLYESYADGVLRRDVYIEKKKTLSEKLAALQDSIRTEKEEQECADELDEEIRNLTKQASQKTYIGGLTKECVDAFVSMVYLYDDQTMKVEFNCEDVIRRALEKYGA